MAGSWFSGSNDSGGGGNWFSGGGQSGGGTDGVRKRILEQYGSNSNSVADAIKSGGTADATKPANTDSNAQKVGHVLAGVGRFAKNAGVSVKTDAVDAWQGLGDVARGTLGAQGIDKNTQLITERNKQWHEQFGNATDEQWKDPAFNAKAKEFAKGTQALLDSTSKDNQRSNEDIKISSKVDAKKTAIASASTFLNATGVYGLAEGLAKTIGVQGAKLVGEQAAKATAKQVLKTGGVDALEQLVKSGGEASAKRAAIEAAKTGGEQVVKSGLKKAGTAVAEGAIFGGGYGGLEGLKGDKVTPGGVLKSAAIGTVAGGVLSGAGELLNAGIAKVFSKGAGETLNELNHIKAEGDQKLLAAGEIKGKGNVSETVIPGKPAQPGTTPLAPEDYTKQFDKLSKSYDAATKAAEAEKSPVKQRLLSDAAHDEHLQALETLNDQYIHGVPNPEAAAATADKTVQTGFQIVSPEQQAAADVLKGPRKDAHIRTSQIDNIIKEAQTNGTNRTPDELRALMRERSGLQDFLDGKTPTAEGVYKPGEAYKPGTGIDEVHQTRSAPDTASKVITDESANIENHGVRAKLNSIFQPVKNFAETTQKSFAENAGARHVADLRARETVNTLKEAAKQSNTDLNFDLAHQIENGTAPKNAFTETFRAIADKARTEANAAGLDIGYVENYVPHIWKQDAGAVDRIARSAGMTARAEGERIVPTYEEGLKLGLKPKYNDPAEMMGDYVRNLETVRGNVSLINDLRSQGLLRTGKAPAGWETVSAKGFPRSAASNQFSAPPEMATVLNNVFGKSDSLIDKGLHLTARVNSIWQDVALAGGIPKTPANFYTFSQMMKEGALGLGQVATGSPIQGAKTIYSPLAAFARSFSSKSTEKFAEANSGFLQDLAKRGAPINFSEGNYSAWDKLFNEPTFGKFMPNLQLNTARNVQNALEKKLGREAALDTTAEIMKKMYGITDQIATGRSQGVQDLIGTVAFAPKYRESIVNVLANTAKSLSPTTWADKSYSLNRRMAAGLGVTYLAYNEINKATTGHGLSQNPDGKDLQLAIPYGGKDEKGNQKVVYIPFMPSFMTVPRAIIGIGQGVYQGDMTKTASEGGKLLSMPIQVVSQLVSNKDYFGRPIVTDEAASATTGAPVDSAGDAARKRLGYVLGQTSPAAGRVAFGAADNAIIQNKMKGLDPNSSEYKKLEKQLTPNEQLAATGAEAPVRFGKFSSQSNDKVSFAPGQVTKDWYSSYNGLSARRKKASGEITQLINDGQPERAARVAEEFNQTIKPNFQGYYKKYGENPGQEQFWNDMLNALPITTSTKAFNSREKSYQKSHKMVN